MSSAKAVIHKVPATDMEALKSPLMGLWEKKRCRNIFLYFAQVDVNDPSTWQKTDIKKQSMREIFAKFGLEENTIDFIGHAVALYPND